MKLKKLVMAIFLLALICPQVRAQNGQSLRPAELAAFVKKARIIPINPHSLPPNWLDFEKVRLGFSFQEKHGTFIYQILGTSSLASTYACRDIAPVLNLTGRLVADYGLRMKETTDFMAPITRTQSNEEDFIKVNLTQAYRLGLLHRGVGDKASKSLHWNPKEHKVMNAQAVGLVLYSFAWWPVEALAATKQIDPDRDRAELDGWFHLWSAIGYEMGVSEELLPTSYARAQQVIALLKAAQFSTPGEKLPEGIPALLGAQTNWLAEMAIGGAPAQKGQRETALAAVAKQFEQVINLSPGLASALGLGRDSAAQLVSYASPKK